MSMVSISASVVPPHTLSLPSSSSPKCATNCFLPSKRRVAILGSTIAGVATLLDSYTQNPSSRHYSAIALQQQEDELDLEEDRIVNLFQETAPSIVFIKDIELSKNGKSSANALTLADDGDAKVEGTGSGFIWDKFGHIVTNYHVVAKLATDNFGLQRCKVILVDVMGNSFANEGTLVGVDPDYDLAVLKVDVEGYKVKPIVVGTSIDLRVGQSCFAIGNPYGYEKTLTTGVVSGLGREIPSPNGRAIRGAIQTDAAINAGNGY